MPPVASWLSLINPAALFMFRNVEWFSLIPLHISSLCFHTLSLFSLSQKIGIPALPCMHIAASSHLALCTSLSFSWPSCPSLLPFLNTARDECMCFRIQVNPLVCILFIGPWADLQSAQWDVTAPLIRSGLAVVLHQCLFKSLCLSPAQCLGPLLLIWICTSIPCGSVGFPNAASLTSA